jgi:uncharacterized OB-fold protein
VVSAEGSGARIRCEECGRVLLAADEDKWRCYRVDDELVFYCPDCAKREFDHGR